MATPKGRQRAARVILWLAAALALVFLGLAAYHLYMRFRNQSDAVLLAELQDATLIEPDRSAGPSDWPQWRGLLRDGVSGEKELLTDWPAEGPKVLWTAEVGEGYSSVTVAAGRALTLFQNAEQTGEVVICWDSDTGEERWRYPYESAFHSSYGSGPRASATVDGDFVYTIGATGILHCLQVATGKKVWSHDLRTEFGAVLPQWGIAWSPLVEGETVYTIPGGPNGNSLAAFDKRTGDLRWKALDDPAGYSSPINFSCAGVPQIVFLTAKGLVGVSPNEGQLLWRKTWPTKFDINVATPIPIHAQVGADVCDYLFISSDYGKGCALVKIVTVSGGLEAQSVYENTQMCNHFSSSVRRGGFLYGFNEPALTLTCMDLRTGETQWENKGPGRNGFGKGHLILAGDKLIIMGETGALIVAEANPTAYIQLAIAQIFGTGRGRGAGEERKWTPPVLAHGRLYVRDEAMVKCLDLRKP
jgi:outer membrane protein assembly factor BamB